MVVKRRLQTWLLLFLLFLCLSCVSSSLRPVDSTNELPPDVPKELKKKFEIKEVGEEASERAALDRAPSFAGKKHKKNRKARYEPPFVYPVRRPAKDPIWVGEKLTYSITYLGLLAADLVVEVLPFKKMNDRKVYHVKANARTSPVFSLFYRVNDSIETFIDYEGNFSHRFHLMLDETKQTRDALELYDSEKKQTFYWNRWNHKVNGYSESKEFAPIEPFSQDSLSALFYVRTVPLDTGGVVSFPLVTEGKSWEAVCTIVRREPMDTPLGKVQAVVIQPEMKYQGILKKSGDSFLWLSDDERRIPIRLEAKVRIGTVVAQLIREELGAPATALAPDRVPSSK